MIMIVTNNLQSQIEKDNKHRPLSKLTQNLKAGGGIQETDHEINKLKSALKFLSPDVNRGNGSFFINASEPVDDYWLGVIWAIASLGWASGKEMERDWSKQAPEKYTEDGCEKAWDEFNPNHENAVGIGYLYTLADEFGWTPAPLSSLSLVQKRFSVIDLKG